MLYKQPEQMFPRARMEQAIRVHSQVLGLKTLRGIQHQQGLWSVSRFTDRGYHRVWDCANA